MIKLNFFSLFIGLVLFISSCKVSVYKYSNRVSGQTGDIYIICNKSKIQLYRPESVNSGYYELLKMGLEKSKINDDGIFERNPSVEYSFKIRASDSGFVYSKYNNQGGLINESNLFLVEMSEVCLGETKTFILDEFINPVYSNGNLARYREGFYYRYISDTTYLLNSQSPVIGQLLEFESYQNEEVDSCLFQNPIRVILDKENGIPLSVSYNEYIPILDTFIPVGIYCTDYKKIRIRKGKLKKVLW